MSECIKELQRSLVWLETEDVGNVKKARGWVAVGVEVRCTFVEERGMGAGVRVGGVPRA